MSTFLRTIVDGERLIVVSLKFSSNKLFFFVFFSNLLICHAEKIIFFKRSRLIFTKNRLIFELLILVLAATFNFLGNIILNNN
jgi:hypothetical protein